MLQINIAGISGLLYLKSPYSAFTTWSTTFSATQRCPPVKNYIYIFNGRLQRFSCWCRKYRQRYTIRRKCILRLCTLGKKQGQFIYRDWGCFRWYVEITQTQIHRRAEPHPNTHKHIGRNYLDFRQHRLF